MVMIDVGESGLCGKWIKIGKTIDETKRLCWLGRIIFLLISLILFAASIIVRAEHEANTVLDSPRIYFSAALFVFGALGLLSAWLIPPLLLKHIIGIELSDQDIIIHFSNEESSAIKIEGVSRIVLAYNRPSVFNYSYDNLKILFFLKNSTHMEFPVGYCKGESVEDGVEKLHKMIKLNKGFFIGNIMDDREYRRKQTSERNSAFVSWIALLIVAAFWLRGIYYEYREIQLCRVGKSQKGMVTDITHERDGFFVGYTFLGEDGKEYHGQSHLSNWVGPVPRQNQQIDILYDKNNFEHNAARNGVSGEFSISFNLSMFSIIIVVALIILKSYGIFRMVYFRKRLYIVKQGVLIEECCVR